MSARRGVVLADLNLAQLPFANLRPIRRAGILFWLACVVLVVVNVLAYWRHFSGESETRERILEIEREEKAHTETLDRLRQELRNLDIANLNDRSTFVNQKIEQRTFSWSSLFDRLTEAQPGDVRLTSLTPSFSHERRSSRGSNQTIQAGEVSLDIEGTAKSGEALLALVDAFFEHPSFRAPDLARESRREDQFLDFSLSVIYRPEIEVPTTADEGTDEDVAEGATSEAKEPTSIVEEKEAEFPEKAE